ncbi:MAG TPA: tRNA lysidine(34) synthetase TilS [Acidobacteriaceae bacterium]|jgi:tRNA(Ile)-lysidine synthase|nr:tRNA lysidine(34) synthetase TilS [Acidobacteriaceae bacterium]
MRNVTRAPEIDKKHLRPGMRLAVAVSGGADSVGLLRALQASASEMGLVLAVAHVHHGIRGADADEDTRFVEALAERLGLECWVHRVDTPAIARAEKQTLEEAARGLRYAWLRELMASGKADAVATAHTLDDQAETVLHRLLRGAWTEGLGGIHPVVECARGEILRPFLDVRRVGIRDWLRAVGQEWREDASNEDTVHTRNRIRRELVPQLAEFNPRITEQLAHLSTIARDEEIWWDRELARLLPGLILPGRAVRGGGRAVSTHPEEGSAGMELERLRGLAAAVRRRVLRAAAQQLGCTLNFEQTGRLMAMCEPSGTKKQELTAELRAEKTARELRLVRLSANEAQAAALQPVAVAIPGEATGFGVTLRVTLVATAELNGAVGAVLRTPRPGDRVRLRHSRGAKPLKEIFERVHVAADVRKSWPVLEWQGRIVWMKDVAVEAEGVPFSVEVLSRESVI